MLLSIFTILNVFYNSLKPGKLTTKDAYGKISHTVILHRALTSKIMENNGENHRLPLEPLLCYRIVWG